LERFITLAAANGKGNAEKFVRSMQGMLTKGDFDGAIKACDVQQGSLANVVKSGLVRYKSVTGNDNLSRDEKKAAIEKELEEATGLELPMMSKNLVIVSTMASIGTLVGLIGTVLGMIRAFAALANAGAPDANALAIGISEALINTALGITGSCIAIIFYNMFTTQIDRITYGIDEANFSILQTFAAKKH
jgi:biopolymer transport protein ExbB